ncbi:nuclear transport factor 2 family protein [Nocardia carnea]|uniref:nuclear transport factor 2 family protein n=1 Tax=Nocardia carnea TaxID=37328 RepID=UPI0024559CAB|nr:nuclear transport factor 2 family protein [Nocardia carnea]
MAAIPDTEGDTVPLDPTTTELRDAVLASPRAVAAHDRDTWVGLFARTAVVNDPVGSAPHTGHEAIARFYDTFIAPNDIAFDVTHDFAGPATVLRDLTITITMPSGARVRVPMHLRYEITEEDGALRIAYLAAYWELLPMVAQLLGTGIAGLRAGTGLGGLLLRNQGVAGLTGMARACTGIGRTGKRIAHRLCTAAAAGDTATVTALAGGRDTVRLWSGAAIPPAELAARARGLRCGKTLAAGRSVTISGETPAGPVLLIADFDPLAPRIETLRVYTDPIA